MDSGGGSLQPFALVSVLAGTDEPTFTEEQKIDFMQHAKVIASQHEKKGEIRRVTPDAERRTGHSRRVFSAY